MSTRNLSSYRTSADEERRSSGIWSHLALVVVAVNIVACLVASHSMQWLAQGRTETAGQGAQDHRAPTAEGATSPADIQPERPPILAPIKLNRSLDARR